MRALFQKLACVGGLVLWGLNSPVEAEETVTLSVKYYRPNGWEDVNSRAERAAQFSFFEKHPEIRLRRWSALSLPGGMFQQADLLAFAGGVAADIQPLFIHQLQFFAQQGLLAPLDEFVATAGRNGGRWEAWDNLPPAFREVGIYDGRIYGIPLGCYTSAFIFNRDRFERAGLDPEHPPETIEDFWKVAQQLTDPFRRTDSGQLSPAYAFTVAELEESYLSFLFAYGTQIVRVEWRDAAGTLMAETTMGEPPPTGVTTAHWKPHYRLAFDSPKALEALGAMWKFRWAPWVREPGTGGIRDITEAEAATRSDVIRGVVFPAVARDDMDASARLRRGRSAFAYVTLQPRGIPGGSRGDVRLMPFPGLRKGDPSPAPLLPIMMGLNSQLQERPRAFLAGWEWIKFQAGPEAARIQNDVFIDDGSTEQVSLWELRRSGMDSLAADFPPQFRAAQEHMYSGRNIVPFFNGWVAVDQQVLNGVIRPMLADPAFDYARALRETVKNANEKVLGLVPPAEQKRRTQWAGVALAVTALAMIVGGIAVVRRQSRQARESTARVAQVAGSSRRERFIYGILMLLPALALLALFSYYPIGKGVVMAFQDYRLVGDSMFTGLQNFNEALFASRFWLSVINTVVFVALNLGIGFLAPFLLAILVSELPKGTGIYRTIFYLPAVTAGLVVSLLWMRLYLPSAEGVLNQGLAPLIGAWNGIMPSSWDISFPLRWLEDPNLAMISVIIPTIWASAGPGSLIYLAALKGIAEETYEAADLDGCGVWKKFTHVTLPSLFPLLLINFIGAFIGAFQGMGNIFIMTGGGPNFSTHVLALEIWQNAFLYLRFGVATAQAWMLAATLIGFVVIQMRILEKMDWRKAQT